MTVKTAKNFPSVTKTQETLLSGTKSRPRIRKELKKENTKKKLSESPITDKCTLDTGCDAA